ncbi:NAD(P)H-binding protein [Rathayibacter sp. CAU 1779]
MLLITGATGHIGTALVRALSQCEAPTRILVRDLERAASFPADVQRYSGDLEDPESLSAAFEGVDRMFLLTQGTGTSMAQNALRQAVRSGIRQIVLLSSTNVFGDPVPAMGRWHHDRELLVKRSGIPWTILRPTGFMSNALQWRPSLTEGGYVLDATGPGRHAVIDPADIAAVASAVLTADAAVHEDAEYTLTGPESLTTGEQVATLADVLGRRIALREVDTAEAVRSRYPGGATPELSSAVVEAWSLMRADTVGVRTDTVEMLTGRPPGTFREWCSRHVRDFGPSPEAA